MSTVNFPNPQYVFTDIKVFANGRNIKIFSVKFSITSDNEYLFVNEEYPIAIQPGPKTPAGELVLLQSEYLAWVEALGDEEKIFDNYHDILILYKPKLTLPVSKRILKHCRIDSYEEGMVQNDKMMKIPLPFKFLGVEKF